MQKLNPATLEQWESESASELSPGIVSDDEVLFQQIVDPTHIDPNGKKLKPTAFQDSANKGMSTHRKDLIDWHDMVRQAHERAENFNKQNQDRPRRALWGFAPFKAADVRRIVSQPSAQRHYFIYDTSNKDDISHADICQGVGADRITERSIRASLFDLAKDSLIQVSE